MGNGNVVYIHNGILSSLQKKEPGIEDHMFKNSLDYIARPCPQNEKRKRSYHLQGHR
jgi:hypothetical protein